MFLMKKNGGAVFFLTTFLVVFCDRVSKVLLTELTSPGFRRQVFPFLDIVHYRNTGIAFGMLQDLGGEARAVLHGSALAAALLFAVLFLRREGKGEIFVAFILGGAIGNSIDRIMFGYVADFIEIHWLGSEALRWPAFNVADFFITVGATALVVKLFEQRGAGKCLRG